MTRSGRRHSSLVPTVPRGNASSDALRPRHEPKDRHWWLLAILLLASGGPAPLTGLPSLETVAAQDRPTSLPSAPEAEDVPVYVDALSGGWADWSWDTACSFSNPSPVHGGSASLAVTFTTAWGGLYLHTDALLSAVDYEAISFWIHGGVGGGQVIAFKIIDAAGGNWDSSVLVTPSVGAWTEVTVALADVGSPATIGGLVWQDDLGGAQPTFYLDDVTVIARIGPPPTPPALSVDAAAGRHPISPAIYGMNFAGEDLAAELDLPVRRWGGNSTTRYNWQNDTYNTGSDWYFENIPEPNDAPWLLPDGSAVDRFVEQDRRTGADSLITVPLIGWSAKRRVEDHPYDCGFRVSVYGPQQSVDPWDADCGNGVDINGDDITGNDPTDTSVAVDPAFVQAWIGHLTGKYGAAAQGGVQYYNLDNEPMLWPYTHRDVHPELTTYDEIISRTLVYAAAVKSADPGAETLGPAVWGWCAYFYSALDGCAPGADHQAHGDTDFLEWYLQQMEAYEQQHDVRLLDYLDAHIYPQAEGIFSDDPGDPATQALRLRSTRALWDPTYVDESWIGQPIYMIPRMRAWVDGNYPGTKLALTEYNWGALGYLNGALAQADLLGIFGRQGLDLATLWGPPAVDQPGAFAFRIYRNYDGAGSKFGETSVSAASTDQDRLAIYAAQRADSTVTAVVINKTGAPLTSEVTLSHIPAASAAQVYRYSAGALDAIVRQPNQLLGPGGFTAAFPAESITLFVIRPGEPIYTRYLPLIVRPD